MNSSLSQRLEAILAETHYDDWIRAQPRGGQRCANIQQLIQIARQFDDLKGEGLYQFVRHVRQLQEEIGDIEPAPLEATDAVRLMSVHQSKGLEFPVVVVADMGKRTDFRDANGSTILHEKYGLCTKIKPAGKIQRYNSLPLVLARQEEKIATVAEEMRLLYVALTRAKNLLICTGAISQNALNKWNGENGDKPSAPKLLQKGSWLNQLASFLQSEKQNWHAEPVGQGRWWNWKVHNAQEQSKRDENIDREVTAFSPEQLIELKNRFSRKYQFQAATEQPSKTSVTQLRRAAADADEEASQAFLRVYGSKDGAERGLAHHRFLQHLDLHGPLSREGLRAQAAAFKEAGVLTAEEFEMLDVAKLAKFWNSEAGGAILRNLQYLHRELPFTYRVSNEELSVLPAGILANLNDGEFVIVQGIADLVVIKPEEIWLLDFKTDGIGSGAVEAATAHYRPQIDLYAAALGAIYKTPVTKKWLHFFAPGETVEI
jgi:ATP-dependent helicase/nuclease subunit A